MESDYRTVMREEFVSKKIGLMEDLEDMKMEQEEIAKKKASKKARRLWKEPDRCCETFFDIFVAGELFFSYSVVFIEFF